MSPFVAKLIAIVNNRKVCVLCCIESKDLSKCCTHSANSEIEKYIQTCWTDERYKEWILVTQHTALSMDHQLVNIKGTSISYRRSLMEKMVPAMVDFTDLQAEIVGVFCAKCLTTDSTVYSTSADFALHYESCHATVNCNEKRKDYITWEQYFMSIAFLSAMRSKDPKTQVGACIVNEERKIVGIGYNGFPNGCDDDALPWKRNDEDPLQTKYPFVCHAEMNAIMNKNSDNIRGCTLYVALFPCNECAKLIIQSGIAHIVYYGDKYHDDYKSVAARTMLDLAKVTYQPYGSSVANFKIDFNTVL